MRALTAWSCAPAVRQTQAEIRHAAGQAGHAFELVRETVQGYRTAGGSAPSEYALTGLGWLFSREEGTGAEWVRGDEGGLEWNLPTAAREGGE